MTQEQIHQLFKHGYNQASWKKFLNETFTGASLLANPDILVDIDSNIASKALKLGYILIDENGIQRQIAIYEITLAKGIILERNRVGLRNLLRKYWKNIDAAFIVYHNPENNKWRFSYVSELTGYDSDGNYLKIQTEPKRYTYVLGEGESSRTASERFELVSKQGNSITLEDIKEAFSVEKLSKAFFDEYKIHYKAICDFMMKKSAIKDKIFNGNEKAIRDFSKKLLGRIVFLYFIQKKGWMGVPIDGKWGQGDFNFLLNIFKEHSNPNLFYTEVLTPLFFDTLNNENRLNNICNIIKNKPCKVPFLNGGLFEEEDKKHREIILDAKLFHNLFDFFNQYNFTIYEDDPNDHTVAVDPEMLGHIFENLLEDNKDKGAYYTPKEIVHYMCQESLIEYLCTTLDIPDENAERRAIEELLKKKHIEPILTSELKNINQALEKVKICDPAIGSGAFPMGLLQEIFSVKQTLWYFEHGNLTNFPASEIKLNIIQNSIYGVDIEKGAVDIARLRFWLSLVVDEEEPKALPNLDYKIVVGNSLLSKLGDDIIGIDWYIDETSQGIFGAETARSTKFLLKEITQSQKEFFKPGSDKKNISAHIRNLKIDLLVHQLELMINKKDFPSEPIESDYRNKSKGKFTEDYNKYLDTLRFKKSIKDLQYIKSHSETKLEFFDWNLDFPEVLNKDINPNVGFDIVIGNPPYVRHERLGLEYKHDLKNRFPEISAGTADLYVYFFGIGLELLKKNGVLNLITLNKYLKTRYGLELRNQLSNQYDVDIIIDFFELPIFEASTDTCITKIISSSGKRETKYFPVKTLDNLNLFELTSGAFLKVLKDNTEWKFLDNTKETILEKLYMGSVSLKEFTNDKIFRGITTGLNEAFVLDNEIAKQLLKSESKDIVKPYAQSTDIRQWELKDNNKFFLATGFDINIKKDYPSAYEYLSQYQKELRKRQDKGNNWWNLRSCKYYNEFENPKIIYIHTAKKHEFYLDLDGRYINNSCYMIISDSSFLFCFLNSKLFEWLKKIKFVAYGDADERGRAKLDYNKMITVPIKIISPELEKKFKQIVELVRQNKSQGRNTDSLEQNIEAMIFKTYNLTFIDVKIVDRDFMLSETEYNSINL